ncbi:diamine acetyltransferase 2 [Agrilus planipennis]|uniref:Diamine acetyltransferase 2 n=1 Tax=Agrilus planipennis TaxID=224129 RepID=A0A1W4W939_AGRPL|nr:diamine acetyltransferase 2 [Agrilus planipennis]
MSGCGNNDFIVRKAKKEDASKILELIKELAVFEKCPDSVKISAKQLEEDGFGEAPAYGCFVAENLSGNIIGFALYFPRYSTWYGKTLFLEDLYIKADYRKNGIGKQLVKEIAKVAKEKSLRRIDFNVLKWNPAKQFYKKLGAVNASENEDFEIYHFYEDAIKSLVQI